MVNASQAQVDLYPPSPNIMLLVDTSGSMEYQVDGSDVTCSPLGGTNNKSRWTQVVEALTGSINNYTCETIDRLSSTFRDGVYRLNNQAPYDYNYTVPFHRALSSGLRGHARQFAGDERLRLPDGRYLVQALRLVGVVHICTAVRRPARQLRGPGPLRPR